GFLFATSRSTTDRLGGLRVHARMSWRRSSGGSMRKVILGVALLAASALAVSTADAAVIFTTAGQSTTQNFSLDVDGPGGLGPITATAIVSVSSISTTSLVLNVQLTNTTALVGGWTQVGLESFGFSVDPNA